MTQTDPRFASLRGATTLITGGAGFIGSHLAHRLVGLGAKVRVIDDLSGGFRENVPAGATLIAESILNHRALLDATTGCDLVFHQAALVSVPLSVEKPDECMRQNVLGTERVLSAAVACKVRRVAFAASAAAYGDCTTLPCREDLLAAPASPYGMSKVAGEMLMAVFSRNFGISTVSLRYQNIFGERQNPGGPYAAAISAFHKCLATGKRPTIFGDGRQTRDWTHVANVVHANLLAAVCPRPLKGEVINVGTGVRTDLLTVLNTLAAAMGVKADPAFGPTRAGDVRDAVADISRAREMLGYEPIVGFTEGIARMLGAQANAA